MLEPRPHDWSIDEREYARQEVRRGRRHAYDDLDPAWSPDGSKIAFSSNRDDQFGEIYVMNADGSAQTQLTTSGFDGYPDWSPDGTKLLITNLFQFDDNGELRVNSSLLSVVLHD